MAKVNQITIERAIDGHRRWCVAAGYSKNTLLDYQNTMNFFTTWLQAEGKAGCQLDAISPDDVEAFMIHMKTQPITRCVGITAQHAPEDEEQRPRAAKTLRNYHIGLASLWSWAMEKGFARRHVVRQVKPPRVHQEPIQPLTVDQVAGLFRACATSLPWHNKPLTTHQRPTAERDRALLALLVETGIRANELINLRLADVVFHQQGGEVTIHMGKGGKRRHVPFQRRAANYLNEWLLIRPEFRQDWLFCNLTRNPGHQMTRDVLTRHVKRLGKRAGVRVSPHLLRTTAACLMVKNGMDVLELQRIMGHSDVATTMRYVRAAQVDLREAMRSASPLDNLRL